MSDTDRLITFEERDGVWFAAFTQSEYRGEDARSLLHRVITWSKVNHRRTFVVLDFTGVAVLAYDAVGAVRQMALTCQESGGRLVAHHVMYSLRTVLNLVEIEPQAMTVVEEQEEAMRLVTTARAA